MVTLQSVQGHTGLTHLFNFYPAIRSIRRDTKFTFHFFMYSYRFLSRGFTDRREILHGGSGSRQGWPSFGRQQGPYGGDSC